jgi:hypothetical protein
VKGLPLELVAEHEFQLFERTVQPSLPGPLPDDFDDWGVSASVVQAAPPRSREEVGSRAPFAQRTRLKVVAQ